jgi:hypothetical protein
VGTGDGLAPGCGPGIDDVGAGKTFTVVALRTPFTSVPLTRTPSPTATDPYVVGPPAPTYVVVSVTSTTCVWPFEATSNDDGSFVVTMPSHSTEPAVGPGCAPRAPLG